MVRSARTTRRKTRRLNRYCLRRRQHDHNIQSNSRLVIETKTKLHNATAKNVMQQGQVENLSVEDICRFPFIRPSRGTEQFDTWRKTELFRLHSQKAVEDSHAICFVVLTCIFAKSRDGNQQVAAAVNNFHQWKKFYNFLLYVHRQMMNMYRPSQGLIHFATKRNVKFRVNLSEIDTGPGPTRYFSPFPKTIVSKSSRLLFIWAVLLVFMGKKLSERYMDLNKIAKSFSISKSIE